MPQGEFGVQSQFNDQNAESDRWRSYQILQNEEKKLGEGNYGDVYKIKHKKNKMIYAAKLLKVREDFMDP